MRKLQKAAVVAGLVAFTMGSMMLAGLPLVVVVCVPLLSGLGLALALDLA